VGRGGAGGTSHSTTGMPTSASTPVSANSPPMPISAYRGGAATSDSANTSPIDMPSAAIALVRCSSRVESAINADTAAEIAPPPCSARPTMVIHRRR
jgi:hypothetical protein